MIEDVFELQDRVGLVAVGTVEGTVKKGMRAFVFFPKYRTARETVIMEIETRTKYGFRKQKSATDCAAGLLLSGFAYKSGELKNAVVTNVLKG